MAIINCSTGPGGGDPNCCLPYIHKTQGNLVDSAARMSHVYCDCYIKCWSCYSLTCFSHLRNPLFNADIFQEIILTILLVPTHNNVKLTVKAVTKDGNKEKAVEHVKGKGYEQSLLSLEDLLGNMITKKGHTNENKNGNIKLLILHTIFACF